MKKCPVCGQVRENEYKTFNGETITVACECACMTAKDTAARNRFKQIKKEIRIQDNRFNGFKDGKTKGVYFRDSDSRKTAALEVCKQYVDRFPEYLAQGRGVLLYGHTGSGKSFLGSCIANELTDKGYSCMVTSLSRLADSISFEDRYSKLNSLREIQLLVLDDLGTERNTSVMNELIYTIIDERYRTKLPVVITTNATIDDLMYSKDEHKQRIYSRLFEMCDFVEVKGKDRRQLNFYSERNKIRMVKE